MHLTAKKDALLPALQAAASIAERKGTMPILSHVRIAAEKGTVQIAATDLNVTIIATVEAEVKIPGDRCLPAKQFSDFAGALAGDTIDVIGEANSYAKLRGGRTEYKIVGLAARDFPALPNTKDVPFGAVEAKALREAIDRTYFNAANDTTRPHLNGVNVVKVAGSESVQFAATDGHRLSVTHCPMPKLATCDMMIPRKALSEIRRLLEGVADDVEIGGHQGSLFLRTGGTLLVCKLIAAQFPPFEQVVPKSSDIVVPVGRVALLDAIKRVAMISSDKTSGIKMHIGENVIRLFADNPELGDGSEDMEVTYRGPSLTIGVNARYMLDWLAAYNGDSVLLQCNGELDPILITPPEGRDYIGVIMPLRV